jgi:hypothetical protein
MKDSLNKILEREEKVRSKLMSDFTAEAKAQKLKKGEGLKLFETKYKKKYEASAVKSYKIIADEVIRLKKEQLKAVKKSFVRKY